jgi:two-component system, NtrC family, response regulator HydG
MKEPAARVLIVDDQPGQAEAAAELLERTGFGCEVAASGEEALDKIRANGFDVVVTDLVMDGKGGMDILHATREMHPSPAVIVVTGFGSVESAVNAMQAGAETYLQKPLNADELRTVVRHAAEKTALVRRNLNLEQQLDEKFGFSGIIGNSDPMHRVFETLRQIAPTDATVLILGESGTGKELIAKAIHANSPRRNRPFVALNCAALSEGILESELFGHEKGAFTGALARRLGRFEYANHGTLFLDEIGDMPPSTQIKLLRVIEQKEIARVGSNEPVSVDVRLVGATHQNLEKLVEEGRFRADLYYRLNVVRIELPPLRERQEDVPLLVDAFLKDFAAQHRKNVTGIAAEALEALQGYPWPGNVRELKNAVESMVVISRNRVLTFNEVPDKVKGDQSVRVTRTTPKPGQSLDEMEKEAIIQTLNSVGGNRLEAAKILGIGERTLYRKLDRYAIR